MKKILFLSCLLLVLLLPLKRAVALTKQGAAEILQEVIKGEFQVLEVREAPLEGFWEIVTDLGHEKMVIYLHRNLRYIIHGKLLDRQVKRNLTFERLKDFRRADVFNLPLENAIPMGNGKRRLYIFTDPQCHFCYILHEELKRMSNIQVFFFLYPLNSASYEKAKLIWCSQDRVKALEEGYQGKEIKSPACDTLPIDKNIEFGKRLFIDSTPTLILQSGKIVEGLTSMGSLENLLKTEGGL